MPMTQGFQAIRPGIPPPTWANKTARGRELEQAEQGLGVAVRSGAQKGQKPNHRGWPPIGQPAETLIRGGSLQKKACEHGINFLSVSKWLKYGLTICRTSLIFKPDFMTLKAITQLAAATTDGLN